MLHRAYSELGCCLDGGQTQQPSERVYRPIIGLTQGKQGQILLIAVLQIGDLGTEEKHGEKLFRVCLDFQRSAWMRWDERLDLILQFN